MKKKWWHGKVAYQIYPKSFLDTTGNGIGDLRGILQKLDYLKDLGIGILWLSPIYCSPLVDQGYDISDYYNIDPLFGTMDDFNELLEEAKKRDIAILMDLVINHCSDEHEWFKKACADPDGKYGQYFYIRDWHEGEPLPCNWRSYFGGSCWEPLPGHPDKIYLHLFHKRQPDLNWENPDLRAELYQMINWWLDKGLAGFRIDAIINIKKVLPFRDFPADREDGLSSIDHMLAAADGIGDFLKEMAENSFYSHDAFTVGEVFNAKDDALADFIGENGYFSSMFDFKETILGRTPLGIYDWSRPTPEQYKTAVFEAQREMANIGFYSNIIENHDQPRGVSHYLPDGEINETSKKMLGGLSLLSRGLPFIYQGQEIGMENIHSWNKSATDELGAKDGFKVALEAGLTREEALEKMMHYSRNNTRTPFQWDATKNAGFSSGTPWLPVNSDYAAINLAEQQSRPDSVFQFYRKLTHLRTASPYRDTFVYGTFTPYLAEQKNLFAYLREGEQTILVAGNFQNEPQTMKLPAKIKAVLLNNLPEIGALENEVRLEGYQFVVLEV
ncbi:MAG: alpha-glucosidase [Lachnospiraceae bacterium]|nr:alpha-glucosidase [Lachnospiraceae bacterium]